MGECAAMLAHIPAFPSDRIEARMGVLDKLRISPEFDEESEPEFDEESVEEIGPVLDDPRRDPSPGEPARATRAPRAKAPARGDGVPRVTKKHREEAAEEVETFLQMIALTWGWQAPPCGEALEAAAPDIAEKVTRLLARNPRWLMRVREGGMLADAVGIAIALKPVIQVAWAHYSAPASRGGEGGVEFDPARFAPYDGSGIGG